MRILVVSSYPPRHCGIGAYARDQVARLRTDGHSVTVLSPPDGAGDLRVPFFGGRPFFRAARSGGGFDRIVVHFQPALYYRPRAVLSKVGTSLGLLWLAVRRRQLDILVHEADPPVRWRPDYFLLRLAFRAAGRVSFHTGAEREALERQYRVRVRAALIPHRVAPAGSGPPPPLEARGRLGVSEDGPVFVCPGFLHPDKGFDRAVRAFAASGSGRLFVVGSVRDHTAENRAHAEKLREECRSTPGAAMIESFLSDEEFDLWMAAADWIVLPYRRSWSSGVLARAHALGRPAIVADVGGLGEQAEGADMLFRDDDGLVRALGEATVSANDRRERPSGEHAHRTPDRETGRGHASPSRHRPSGSLAEWDPEFQPPLAKKGKGMLFGLILASVLLATAAQLTLKHGMTQVTHRGADPLDLTAPVAAFRRIVTNASVWAGLLTFVVSAAVWLLVLSRVSLSFAYPFVSITYVLIVLFDRVVLHETVSGLRWSGVALIVAGILLVSRTHQTA
jgi:glycosyltransferase involved in cell wall biosynthesis/multidrug transporter EmrE-like cation transporter